MPPHNHMEDILDTFGQMATNYVINTVAYYQMCSVTKTATHLCIFLLFFMCTFRYWVILLCFTVISYLVAMLIHKAMYARSVHLKLRYGFYIICILSFVWSYMCLYEKEKAGIHARLAKWNNKPPDCEYHEMSFLQKWWYDEKKCIEYYHDSTADPLWRVNPFEAISLSIAMFLFPLDYIGGKIGSFFTSFIGSGSLMMQPILAGFAIMLLHLIFRVPFRIRTSIFTFESAIPTEVNDNHLPGHGSLSSIFTMLMAAISWMLTNIFQLRI